MSLQKGLLIVAVLLQVVLLIGCGEKLSAPMITSCEPGDESVQVTWSAVSGATGYKLYQAATSGGPYTYTGKSTTNATTVTADGLTNGTTYFFVVTAVGQSGESAYSNEVNERPMGSPDVQDDFGSYEVGSEPASPWMKPRTYGAVVAVDPVSGSKAAFFENAARIVHTGVATANGIFSARVRALSATGQIYFEVRYQDEGNKYHIQIDGSQNQMTLTKTIGHNVYAISQAALPAGTDLTVYHLLSIQVTGTNFKVSLDDQQILTAADSSLSSAGQTSIGLSNGYFDDFKVYYE